MIFLMSISIPLIMIIIMFILKKNIKLKRMKSSPFECGFEMMNSFFLPFSIQFFLIMIMFLIFDIEISIIIPFIPSMMPLKWFWLITFNIFLIILILGLYFEWMESSMNWLK